MDDAGNAPRLQDRFNVIVFGGPADARFAGVFLDLPLPSGVTVTGEGVGLFVETMLDSKFSSRRSMFSFHLSFVRMTTVVLIQRSYDASLSSSICRLLFTVHDSPRDSHRVHGGFLPFKLHFIYRHQLVVS